MNVFKDFLLQIRRISLKDVYISLGNDVIPRLAEFVRFLLDVKFEDGSYHTYYFEIKRGVEGFMTYYNTTIDRLTQEEDRCSHVMTRDELLKMIQKTMEINYDRQVFFGKKFLPLCFCDNYEKDAYENIEKMFEEYKAGLMKINEHVTSFQKQDTVDKFAAEHFPLSMKYTSELFSFTHVFISMMLTNHIKEIRISLEETITRARNNFKKLLDEHEESTNELLHQLYDKNKESLQLSRRQKRCSVEAAEVTCSIQMLQDKIQSYKSLYVIQRTDRKVQSWKEKLKRFNFIAGELDKLRAEQYNVTKQQTLYNSLRTTELPGSKKQCWLAMEENFRKRQEFLKEKITEFALALTTFFKCRGFDHIQYKTSSGLKFHMDLYNHQVYSFNDAMDIFHVDCEGNFKRVPLVEKYYFDANGRYVLDENKEKVYKCSPCTSSYKLGEDGLLKKITKDCGHADDFQKGCQMQFHRSIKKNVVVPDIAPKDIKSTLDKEVVKYLWDNFGHVLPDALHDVGNSPSNNPIQQLGHSILKYKYNTTISDFDKKKKEAAVYRTNIFNERHEKAVKASIAWKAKQTKRRKPQESDDTEDRATYNAQMDAREQIKALNYYYT